MNISPTVTSSEKVHSLYEKSEGLAVSIAVIGAYVFMSLIFWGISGFANRKKKEEKTPVLLKASKWAIAGVFVLTTVIYSLFLTLAYSTILLSWKQLPYSQGWKAASVIDIILIVGLMVLAGLSWLGIGKTENKSYWSIWGKINFSIMATLCVVFIWSFSYWDLLGI
jgi:hypothetical protein